MVRNKIKNKEKKVLVDKIKKIKMRREKIKTMKMRMELKKRKLSLQNYLKKMKKLWNWSLKFCLKKTSSKFSVKNGRLEMKH